MKFRKKGWIIAAGLACILGTGALKTGVLGAESTGQSLTGTKAECFMGEKEIDPLQPRIAEKILRFHVLANSDTKEDQELKLKVRDAIGTYLSPILQDVENLQETKELVQNQLPQIIEVAEACIQEEGYDYEVTAEVGYANFPEKTYGNYTFPPGEYEALEVYIGKAKGHNWWCVLYPNMCFQGSVYEVVDEESEEALKEVLTPEEYQDVFTEGNYEIEFKFWENMQVFLDRIQETILSSDK